MHIRLTTDDPCASQVTSLLVVKAPASRIITCVEMTGDAVIQDRDTVTQDRDTVIPDRDTVIPDRNTVIQDRNKVIQDRDTVIQDRGNPYKRQRLERNSSQLSPGSFGRTQTQSFGFAAAESSATFHNIGRSEASQSGFGCSQSSQSFDSIERAVPRQLSSQHGNTVLPRAGRSGVPGTTFNYGSQSSLRRSDSVFQQSEIAASSGEHGLIHPAVTMLTFDSSK